MRARKSSGSAHPGIARQTSVAVADFHMQRTLIPSAAKERTRQGTRRLPQLLAKQWRNGKLKMSTTRSLAKRRSSSLISLTQSSAGTRVMMNYSVACVQAMRRRSRCLRKRSHDLNRSTSTSRSASVRMLITSWHARLAQPFLLSHASGRCPVQIGRARSPSTKISRTPGGTSSIRQPDFPPNIAQNFPPISL